MSADFPIALLFIAGAVLVPFTREERTEAESTAVLAAAPLAVKASLE